MNWVEALIAIAGTGVLSQFFNHARNSRRDAARDKLAAAKIKLAAEEVATEKAKANADGNLKFLAELMQEQREWRDTMRKEITNLQLQLGTMQQVNAELMREVALLKARNQDLQQDNDELEKRVKELERELREKHAASTGGSV